MVPASMDPVPKFSATEIACPAGTFNELYWEARSVERKDDGTVIDGHMCLRIDDVQPSGAQCTSAIESQAAQPVIKALWDELEEQAVKINPAVRAARNGNGVLYITHRYTSIDRRRGKAPARARGARLRLRSPRFPRVDGAPVCVVRRARVSRYDPERAQTTLPGDLGRTASLPSLVSQHVYELDLRSGPKKGHTCVGDRIVGNPTLSVHLPAPVTAQPSTDHSSLSASPSRDQFFSHHSQASVGPSPMPVRPPPAARQRRRAVQLTREPSSRRDRCERSRSSEARASR